MNLDKGLLKSVDLGNVLGSSFLNRYSMVESSSGLILMLCIFQT